MAAPDRGPQAPVKAAAVLLIGDELLGGVIHDRNLAAVARALGARGVALTRSETVSDEGAAIAAAAQRLAGGCDILVVTGGLGATHDDVTRAAMENVLETVETPIANRVGQALGIRGRLCGAAVWVLPGVPAEAHGMIADLAADLPGAGAGRSVERQIATAGRGEMQVAALLDQAGFTPPEGLRLGFLPHIGGVLLRLSAPAGAADQVLDESAAELRRVLGELALPAPTIEESLVQSLRAAAETLVTAESCTGGGIGARITDVAGASSVYLGGIVAYADHVKQERLGVDPRLLAEEGAVSEAVARAMAEGARHRFHSDWALAVTGIAGPTGGTPDKPVGTVWIALAGNGETWARLRRFPGNRDRVRQRTVMSALEWAYRRGREWVDD